MTVALDANGLLRFADAAAAQHPVAVAALSALRAQGHPLRTLPQSVYEFWVVATRPIANNGLGLSTTECEQAVARILTTFPVLDDRPALFTEWQALVVAHDCKGKDAHDARYVAAVKTHGLSRILTFNAGDFARYPDLTVLDPAVVAAPNTPGGTP